MAAAAAEPGAGGSQAGDSSAGAAGGGLPSPGEQELSRRLERLYPAVNQQETPLPRSWSPKDKYNYIGLSQNNLRVHYKGHGKNHKDAASVRAMHPIPAACGIYYFEVKIVSKGRDGYMGIGLSAQGVNMNRLPGWDKHSYGYHGDDGHSFCSSGTGQPYGPTFTTGDVIGCCVNLINNTCFYTKNGHSLGIAFTDLPVAFRESSTVNAQLFEMFGSKRTGEESNLYPTVGLQTPGEIVDANFGQQPFVFDIEDYMREWRAKIQGTIKRFPVGDRLGEWQDMLQNMVSSYLVHHGYCATATAFARITETTIQEEQTSIKNRQRIQKLVLAGRVGEAIEATQQLYPGLLDHNPNLLFMLNDSEMEVEAEHYPNGVLETSATRIVNGAYKSEEILQTDESGVEDGRPRRQLCGGNQAATERIILFGRELQALSEQLGKEYGKNVTHKEMLQDAFSLLAYSDPWNCPVGQQLDPIQREPVCAALNSAILESQNLPKQPPLMLALGQATECLRLMARVGLGSCSFARVDDYLH
ncbi:ran-binding protein 10 isoform X4 [Ornithorhynchus anatinus]|uniref:ran-binding protein 10 isoform X4 n=1 Tax=Ornithorhynchus anatinus TaxID=9258 RepID=UPI0010A91FC8|nr:ran-binding protein 10 isoform X4 [Ornithorhynchus anatinus]